MKKKEIKIEAEEIIRQRIFIIRNKKVMLDIDLAKLYQVPTKRLNEQVKRNINRFPEDFMFQLTEEEVDYLRLKLQHKKGEVLNWSQFATSSQKHRGVSYLPFAFTEHGATMLSSVLKSNQAVQMSIFIVRAFIKMRESLETYKDLALKIGEIEVKQIEDHAMLKNVHAAVKHLLEKPPKPKGKMGFDPSK